MPPPVHFGAYLSPIHEVPYLEEEESGNIYNQEAMEPLTFLPEVDSVPLTPASREALRHPPGPFQATPSAEDLAILSGIASPNYKEDKTRNSATNRGWSGTLKELLWSFGASALAAISGESSSLDAGDDPSNHSSSNSAAVLAQWPSSDHLTSESIEDNQDEWVNLEENEMNLGSLGFPFSFGSAEPSQPLVWD